MKPSRMIAAGVLSAIAGLLVVGPADAGYSYKRTCNGVPTKWKRSYSMLRNTCSMEFSEAIEAFNNAGFQWGQTQSSMQYLGLQYSTCFIQNGNGINEVARVARSAISGNNGLATYRTSGCGSSEEFIESDAMVANDMSLAPADESFWGWTNNASGRNVLLHEFGHVVGLDDRPLTADNFNVMRSNQPEPLTGGHGTGPYPDDALGVRTLYAVQPPRFNLFASAQRMLGSNVTSTDAPGTIIVCRNATFNLSYTVASNGNQSAVTTGFRIYINNTGVPGTGTNLFTGTATTALYGMFTEVRTLRIPINQPFGLYWIFWQVDTGNALSEYIEGDNTVHSAMTIRVNC